MSRRSVRLATALAVSAGLVLTSAACSGGSDGGKHKDSASAPPKQTLNQVNPVDAAKLKQGGTLNFPVDQYSTQWNNLNASAQNELSIQETMETMLPRLFLATADNTISPNPDYLTSANDVLKGGKQVTTYEINPKAKWSDGTPITWKDFQVEWQTSNGKDPKYTPLQTTGYEQIESVVQGKNAQEVIVTYSKPFADWQSLFSLLYPASQQDTPEKFANAYKNKIPVTAGPFKLGKMDPTTKVVSVVRDPKWWGKKPVLDGINFRTLDGASTPGAFASGEIDVNGIGPDVAAYKQAKQVKGASIRVSGGPDTRQLFLNGASSLLKDQSVRQAIFMALDRDAIAKADLNGLPYTSKPTNNHFLTNNADGYQDNAGDLGKYDPKKAAAQLDAAGWKKGADGVRAKGGKPLALTLAIPSGTPVATNEAQLFTAMLKAVGVKVNTKPLPTDSFFPDVEAGKFDMTVFSLIGANPFFPLSNASAQFRSPQHGNVGQNYSRIGTPEIDAAMTKAGTEVDHSAYMADIQTADKALWQLAVNLPLYQRPQVVSTKSTVANYGAMGFQSRDWTTIGFTK